MVEFDRSTPEAAATQAIRDYCGWHVAPSMPETITLDGSGTGALLLPSRFVKEVRAVRLHGELLSEDTYEWSVDGILRRRHYSWPDRYRCVEVDIVHGFEDEAVLAGMVAAIAARVKLDPTGALSNQRAGTQSVGFSSSATGGGLMQSEKDRLAPYKLTWGP